MKKYLIIILSFLLMSTSVLAIDVPKAVSDAFSKKFPAASEIKWSKENAKEYEADFRINGKHVSANFLADGTWVETEMEIGITDLPEPVITAVKNKYTDAVIIQSFKIEKANGGITYETEFKTGGKKRELILNADGTTPK